MTIASAKAEKSDGAWVQHCTVTLPGASDGPLAGLTFAIKDLFDVKGALPTSPD
jgi:Asp-tRNA(Asn)/Glu-tRNA(Gln) amidotransferase A subunit family amidase